MSIKVIAGDGVSGIAPLRQEGATYPFGVGFRIKKGSGTIKVKSEAIKVWVFFRMRKRHLLPALHDGMQGDEDGMQTCERPPLWAFGWPRGGVHMFTSLHVACLARVA